jgi:hypothetical protein
MEFNSVRQGLMGQRRWISSTSDGLSKQYFLTNGALACHKWTFLDDCGGLSRNMSDFVNMFFNFLKSY